MTTPRPSQLFPEFRDVPGLDDARTRDYPYAELALAIARLRGERELTQTEFAQRIGTTQSVIARVESGRHGVQISLLNRIADAFGAQWNLTFGDPGGGTAASPAERVLPAPSGDALVDEFNLANTSHDFEQAHRVANKVRRSANSARRRLVLALDAFNRARYERAIHWSRSALSGTLPKASREVASIVLGRSLLASGQPGEALLALKSAGETWTAKAARAEALMDSDHHAEAIGLAEQLMADADADELPGAAYLAARVSWHADRPLKALERIGIFRSLRPEDREGILLHGAILGHLGDLHSDPDCHRAALALFESIAGKNDSEVLRLVAMTAGRLGRWRDAISAAQRARELTDDADYDRSASGIARDCFRDIDDADELLAAADYVEELGLLPAEELRSQRALAHALKGSFDQARDALALPGDQLSEASAEDQIRCAIAYLVTGELEQAFPILRDNAEALSKPDGQLQLARAALAAGDTATARSALKRVATDSGPAAQTATVALDLLKAIDAVGAQAVLARLAPAPDPATPRVLAAAQPTSAPESEWEGPEDISGKPSHLGASLFLNRAAQERMSVSYVH